MSECANCEYYDEEDDVCLAFECYGLDCVPLPCEEGAVTVGYIRFEWKDEKDSND